MKYQIVPLTDNHLEDAARLGDLFRPRRPQPLRRRSGARARLCAPAAGGFSLYFRRMVPARRRGSDPRLDIGRGFGGALPHLL